MTRKTQVPVTLIAAALAFVCPRVDAQTASSAANLPRVVIPTSQRQPIIHPSSMRAPARIYPWRKDITATLFWIGEKPGPRNPTPNHKSSWDTKWRENFGGYDNPDPSARVANHRTGEFRPRNFIPGLNPFYIALPYNDVQTYNSHKPEAMRVIPWFRQKFTKAGRTTLKGRWVQIHHEGRSCFAQWEDCGPWTTDDWKYVFGGARPQTRQNGGAGIDISPAIRDYLGLESGEKCHWRFIDDAHVPYGPWRKYAARPKPVTPDGTTFEAKREYMEYLRKLRDEQTREKSYGSYHRH